MKTVFVIDPLILCGQDFVHAYSKIGWIFKRMEAIVKGIVSDHWS